MSELDASAQQLDTVKSVSSPNPIADAIFKALQTPLLTLQAPRQTVSDQTQTAPSASARIQEITPAMQIMQNIVNKIPEEVLERRKPVVIAFQKIEGQGRHNVVSQLLPVKYDPTSREMLDTQGDAVKLKRGMGYVLLELADDKTHVDLTELQIPDSIEQKGKVFIPSYGVHTRHAIDDEILQEIITKYSLDKLQKN